MQTAQKLVRSAISSVQRVPSSTTSSSLPSHSTPTNSQLASAHQHFHHEQPTLRTSPLLSSLLPFHHTLCKPAPTIHNLPTKLLSFTLGLGLSHQYAQSDSTSFLLPTQAHAQPAQILKRPRYGYNVHKGDDRFDHGGLRQDMFLEFPMVERVNLPGSYASILFQTAEDHEMIKMPPTSFVVGRVENPVYVEIKDLYLQATLTSQPTVQIESEYGTTTHPAPAKKPIMVPKDLKRFEDWKKATQKRLQDKNHTFIHRMDGEKVDRFIHAAYFPTFDGVKGQFGIMIDRDLPKAGKRYDGNHETRVELTKVLDSMQSGDCIEFMGPFYTDFPYRPYTFEEIIMLVGDPLAIPPCIQIINAIVMDPNDRTRVHLVYCNESSDKVCYDEQLNMSRNYNMDQIVISWLFAKNHGILDFQRGFIENVHYGELTKYKLHRLIGKRSQQVQKTTKFLPNGFPAEANIDVKRKIVVSGSNAFMKQVCGKKKADGSQGELKGWLKELGYQDFEVMKF